MTLKPRLHRRRYMLGEEVGDDYAMDMKRCQHSVSTAASLSR